MADPNATVRDEHLDAAAWALGVLDPDDAARFEIHLESCAECQREVAGFGPAAGLLKTVVPVVDPVLDDEPPAGLAERTLAGVERAARKAQRRRRNMPLLTAAAAIVIAAAGIGTAVSMPSRSSTALSYTIPLRAVSGVGYGSGQAVAHQTGDGWSIQLTVQDLPALPADSFYECWYAAPGSGPGHPDLITAGTFTVGAGGDATVQMWSAADPRQYPTMEITAERSGDAAQHGAIILSGVAHQ